VQDALANLHFHCLHTEYSSWCDEISTESKKVATCRKKVVIRHAEKAIRLKNIAIHHNGVFNHAENPAK
jgi:hypothetical protein